MSAKAQTIIVEQRMRTAGFSDSSINVEKGTIDAIFATDAPVRSYHSKIGDYYEILGFEAGMVRLERMNTSAPVLDNHRRYEKKLGTVDSCRVDGKTLLGTMRYDIGGEIGKEAFRQVKDKITKSVSIGYKVYALRYMSDHADGTPIYLATDWEPFEISEADIPADYKASMRTEGDTTNQLTLTLKTNSQMETKPQTAEEIEKARIAKEAADLEIRNNAMTLERNRVNEVTTLCIEHQRDNDFLQKHLKDGTTVDAVRTLILADKKDSVPAIRVGNVLTGFATEEARADAMTTGILHRADAKMFPLPAAAPNNPFAHKRLMDFCTDYLKEKNLPVTGGDSACVQRAMNFGLQNRSSMSTSDFPNIFANVLQKTLRKDYTFTTGEWKPFCYKQDATRVNSSEKSIQLGDWAAMEKVKEGADYKRQSVSEGQESFTAYKYGSEFAITLEMIINDDLGAIMRMATKAVQMGSFTEDNIVWSLILSNPLMSDGKNVFSTAHKNLASGAAMTATTLNELYQKVRLQKGLNDIVINLRPSYVVCGPTNELIVDQLLRQTFVPTKPEDTVAATFIRNMKPIVTPFITDGSYYVIAEPSAIDNIRYGGVVGEPDFTMQEVVKVENDAWLWHARKFFGAAFTDYRGMAKNPGA